MLGTEPFLPTECWYVGTFGRNIVYMNIGKESVYKKCLGRKPYMGNVWEPAIWEMFGKTAKNLSCGPAGPPTHALS